MASSSATSEMFGQSVDQMLKEIAEVPFRKLSVALRQTRAQFAEMCERDIKFQKAKEDYIEKELELVTQFKNGCAGGTHTSQQAGLSPEDLPPPTQIYETPAHDPVDEQTGDGELPSVLRFKPARDPRVHPQETTARGLAGHSGLKSDEQRLTDLRAQNRAAYDTRISTIYNLSPSASKQRNAKERAEIIESYRLFLQALAFKMGKDVKTRRENLLDALKKRYPPPAKISDARAEEILENFYILSILVSEVVGYPPKSIQKIFDAAGVQSDQIRSLGPANGKVLAPEKLRDVQGPQRKTALAPILKALGAKTGRDALTKIYFREPIFLLMSTRFKRVGSARLFGAFVSEGVSAQNLYSRYIYQYVLHDKARLADSNKAFSKMLGADAASTDWETLWPLMLTAAAAMQQPGAATRNPFIEQKYDKIYLPEALKKIHADARKRKHSGERAAISKFATAMTLMGLAAAFLTPAGYVALGISALGAAANVSGATIDFIKAYQDAQTRQSINTYRGVFAEAEKAQSVWDEALALALEVLFAGLFIKGAPAALKLRKTRGAIAQNEKSMAALKKSRKNVDGVRRREIIDGATEKVTTLEAKRRSAARAKLKKGEALAAARKQQVERRRAIEDIEDKVSKRRGAQAVATKELWKLRENASDLRSQLLANERLLQELKSQSAVLDELGHTASEMERLSGELKSAKAALSKSAKGMDPAQAERLRTAQRDLETAQTALRRAERKAQRAIDDFADVESAKRSIDGRIAGSKSDFDKIKRKIELNKQSMSQQVTSQERLADEIRDLQKSIEKKSPVDGSSPKSKLIDANLQVGRASRSVAEMDRKIHALDLAEKRLENQVRKSIGDVNKEVGKIGDKIARLSKKRVQLDAKLKEISSELAEAEDAVEQFKILQKEQVAGVLYEESVKPSVNMAFGAGQRHLEEKTSRDRKNPKPPQRPGRVPKTLITDKERGID